MRSLTLLLLLLCGHTAFAASTSSKDLPPPPPPPPPAARSGNELPPPPPPPATSGGDCYPACRAGYFCYGGQCVSSCNPPCINGEVCSNGSCVEGDGREARDVPEVREGQPPPPGYHYESQRKKGMIIAGAIPFGIGYVLSIIYGVAMASSFSTFGDHYNGAGNFAYLVPVFGPIIRNAIAFGAIGMGYNYVALDVLTAIIFEAAELVGATFLVVGMVKTSQTLVRNGESSAAHSDDGFRISLLPVGPRGSAGLTLMISH